MLYQINFYKDKNGKIHALQFLKRLKKEKKELWEQLNAATEKIKNSEYQKRPFSAPLKRGLHEVRAHYRTQQARIIYTFAPGCIIKLLNGYVKGDTGSEKSGITFGRKLLKELKEREKENE